MELKKVMPRICQIIFHPGILIEDYLRTKIVYEMASHIPQDFNLEYLQMFFSSDSARIFFGNHSRISRSSRIARIHPTSCQQYLKIFWIASLDFYQKFLQIIRNCFINCFNTSIENILLRDFFKFLSRIALLGILHIFQKFVHVLYLELSPALGITFFCSIPSKISSVTFSFFFLKYISLIFNIPIALEIVPDNSLGINEKLYS